MLVLQDDWIADPEYSALILRKTFVDLNQPEGILTRAHEWLDGQPNVYWEAKHNRFVFESGAKIQFGHCNGPRDHLKYRGGKYNIVCWDELTDFQENQYTFLFSRQRRSKGSNLPLLTASASNPGGPGHAFVKSRLVYGKAEDRIFMPAYYTDNEHLDQEEYGKTLDNLLPVEQARIKRGDWDAIDGDTLFEWDWFKVTHELPKKPAIWGRSWDTGATEGGGDPTVGLAGAMIDGTLYLTDMIKGQFEATNVDAIIKETAKNDGYKTMVILEQEPGSGSKRANQAIIRSLRGYRVISEPSTQNKYARAMPAARAARKGRIVLVEGPWIGEFLDVVCNFTGKEGEDSHDDEVDALSMLFNYLDARVKAELG